MKYFFTQGIPLAFVFVFTLVGCNRTSPPPTPLTLEELPGVLEKAFSKAKPEAKEMAVQVVSAVRAQDYPKAFGAIQTLAGVPDLTTDQANVAARATLTISSLLQSAQTQGDTKSGETIKRYMETK